MLEIDNVSEYFAGPGDVVRAVDGALLSVGEGEFVAIFGPSGSGKTTFLMLAAGLLIPDSGEVRFNGEKLSSFSRAERARYRSEKLGFIFQSFNLIPGLNALENIALSRLLAGVSHKEATAEAEEMLKLVGLENRAKHLPTQLSGGEQQRVAIARALSGKPSLILADEPTGNLDTKRGAEVLALLTELAHESNTAVIMVTHDIRAAEYADRIKEMRDGKLFDHFSSELEAELAKA